MGGLTWKQDVEIGYNDFNDEFSIMRFPGQVDLFVRIIQGNYWFENSLLCGRFFGAWILLNALMKPDATYPGTVIVISTVLGFGGIVD